MGATAQRRNRQTEPEAPEAPEQSAEDAKGTGTPFDQAQAKAVREKNAAEKKAAVEALTEMTQRDTPFGRQVKRAVLLEQRREALTTEIDDNREYLRLMQKNGEATEDESAWLAKFHPVKIKDERKSKDDVDATRKAKEAARAVEIKDEATAEATTE